MITSLISMKGGTAKTTTAVNLAAYLALGGLRVLLVDLDPQNFATLCLGLDVQSLKYSLADVLLEERPMQDAIVPTGVPGLSIVPADRRLASSDVLLADVPGREKILKGRIDKLRLRYDHILIDNPPSLNLLTINALIASDNYVITVSPSYLSLVGLQSLLETVDVIKKNMHSKVELLGILPTMVDFRMKITTETLISCAHTSKRRCSRPSSGTTSSCWRRPLTARRSSSTTVAAWARCATSILERNFSRGVEARQERPFLLNTDKAGPKRFASRRFSSRR